MQDLRTLFEGKYPGKERLFEALIKPIFSKATDTSLTDEQVLVDSDRGQIKSCSIIAQVRGGFPIIFADVELQDTVNLKRSRVNIQNCVRRIMENNTNAIIFFHFTDNAKEWRVSYVHRAGTNGNSTSAKRHTYLCGPEHSCRTVSERFETLKGLATIKDEDMAEAFSVEPLSKEFFDAYKTFYEDFVQYITGSRYVKVGGKYERKVVDKENAEIFGQFKEHAGGDYDLACKLVRDYVKKLMGRLVFLHFLQKKGWLGVKAGSAWGSGDRNFIQNLFANADDGVKDDFLSRALEPLFFRTLNTDRGKAALAPEEISAVYGGSVRIPYLNGGLFEEDELDKKRVRFRREDFKNLLDFFSRYNFTIDEGDPTDKEIGIDPEMLGKIFENLLEDNKDKGAFYTPKEIVQYMCRESLCAYLCADGDADAGAVRRIMERGDAEGMGEGEKSALLGRLHAVKVCDPAVGSGAFPMGMMNELFALRAALGDTEEPSEIKKQIVRDNIYGVDIEKGAVDIARLRFWLAIIVDEQEPIPLPNLDYKIMRGNSLLESVEGVDLSALTKDDGNFQFAADEISYLLELLKTYFDKHAEKEAIRDSIKEAVIDLVRNRGTNASALEKLERIPLHDNSDFFLWHTWFGDVFSRKDGQGGFDIVIGNPPYIKEYTNKSVFDGFREHSPYYMGKMDLWYGFACHGIDLLKEKGILCFIAQNNWTTSSGAKLMRKKIIKDGKIRQLLDFNTYMVFESADIQTMIMLFERNSKDDGYTFDYRTLLDDAQNDDMLALLGKQATQKTKYLSPKIVRSNYANKLLTFSENDSLFEKIAKWKEFLQKDEVAQGIVFPQDFLDKKGAAKLGKNFSAGDSIFGLTQEKLRELSLTKYEKTLIKPYYTSEQIHRNFVEPKNSKWVIYTDSSFKEKGSMDDYPNLKKHLDKYVSILTSDNKPYGLHRAREERFFQGEKILSLRKCVEKPSFSWCDFDTYVTQTYFIIQTSRWNMKFLTGVLNSKLIAYWLKHKGKMQGANYQVDKEPLLGIPLPKNPTAAQQKPVIALVDKILTAKKQDPAEDTSAREAQIDDLVYALYGLTAEEIAVVEGR